MKKLYGIVCANITPMTEKGEIDIVSLRKLVNRMAEGGIHGVYPTGTNGEAYLLRQNEQHAIAKAVIEENAGRMSTFIQCATMFWEETMENISYACDNGADGVGVMTPIFFKADDVTMKEYYYEAALAAHGKPVYAYNITKMSANDISPKVFGEIIDENPNVMGIKYSMPDIQRIQDYLRAPKTRKAEALIGADSLITASLAAGCVGEVAGAACVFPKRYVKAYEAFVAGDTETALEMQNRIVACSRAIKPVAGIPAIKAMLKMQGVIESDACRRPFRKLTVDEYKMLEQQLNIYEKETY